MSQDDYWSELPPLHEGDVDFNWEDFLNEPTLEPNLGFEGKLNCASGASGGLDTTAQSYATMHEVNTPLWGGLNQDVEPWMIFGAPAQPQLGFSPYEQPSEIKFNEPEYRMTQATFHSAVTSEPPQREANNQHLNSTSSASSVERQHACDIDGCEKSYVHRGDLERHIVNVHRNPSRFLCHFHRCPRGIKGRGFPRMDKLVDHLKSRKHDLEHDEAVYEAAKHNPPQFGDSHYWARRYRGRAPPMKVYDTAS